MRRYICLVVASLFAVSCGGSPEQTPQTGRTTPSPTAASTAAVDPVIAAAGDIACSPHLPAFNDGRGTRAACRQRHTSDLLVSGGYAAVLALGDLQYDGGELGNFRRSYEPSWGRLKAVTHPVPGNHEYSTPRAAGYFAYFGSRAGSPALGYYSFDVGAWHLIALNSNCGAVGGCGSASPQTRWLRADLAAHQSACTLAYWHHPRFSSGLHGDDETYDAFWRALYEAGADVVLAGHDHSYERFAPQDPSGRADPARGIRQFVVGTGGRSLYPFRNIRPNSEIRNSTTYGVLAMTLRPDRFEWRFIPEKGKTFTDSGSGACH